jgi:murein L,D-transpeptidase YcbB/YkuD
LFERSDRTLSHGCIRVDDPVGLAADVLANPQWSRDAVRAEIDTGATQTIRLDTPLPIFILYVTAAADADGVVHYASDVYARNGPLLRQLEHAPARTLAALDVGPVRCAG